MNTEKARFNMIEQHVKPWNIFDERLIQAMTEIPREKFVPQSHQSIAFADVTIPLGHHQMMLAPRTLARMIQELKLTGKEKVLDVGCGSGYTSAILSKLAAKVYTIDIIEDFVVSATQRYKKLGLNNIHAETADASNGYLSQGAFDAIIITTALSSIPENFKRALNPGGRMVAILGKPSHYEANLCHLNNNKDWVCEVLFPIDAQPMVNAEEACEFVF